MNVHSLRLSETLKDLTLTLAGVKDMYAIMCPSPVPPCIHICGNNPRRQFNVYVRYLD